MFAGWVNRGQQASIEYLKEENRVLRELHGAKRLCFNDEQRARLARKAKALPHAVLREIGSLVTPDTMMRWYRRLIAHKYDGTGRRGPGRRPEPQKVRELVVRLATDNPGWGYTRIRDVMWHLGRQISRTTVRRILKADGIEPAPQRLKHMPWGAFLKAHWGAIAAIDFFQVEVLTRRGPVRYAVLFVMDLKSRRVEIAGIIHDAYEEWMVQRVRNLTDGVDGFLLPTRYLIMDRDPLFTTDFRAMLASRGVEPVRLPPRSPNLNAYAERFIRSVRQECLGRVIPLSEAHLRQLLREYVAHYHHERPHQGLDGALIEPANDNDASGPVVRRERLGGLLNHYYREAA